MKKLMLVALGATALVGCQATPEKPAEPQTAPKSAAVVAEPAAEPQVAKSVAAPVEQKVEPAPQPVAVAAAAPVVKEEPRVAPVAKPAPMVAPKVSDQAKGLDPRMDKIVKLINTSSGARQVISSSNPKAKELHEQAKALYQQATVAGTKKDAGRLLNEAVKAMYGAIRAASKGTDVLADKRKADFDKLKRSVATFMEQHQRISEEKGADAEGEALRSQVLTLKAEADKSFAAKEYATAQQLLRESFEMLRNSIESMREGETLVRSLNFATKKDEYDYELERYKSQRLLVDVLLKKKRESSAYIAKQVNKYIGVAEEARAKAESAASGGDHESAISLLEDARKQIVRALRTGGIYVPG